MAEAPSPVMTQPPTEPTPMFNVDPALKKDPGTPAPTPSPTQVGGTPGQATFWNGDPNTLSPEARAIYNNMQADYTRKTMELSGKEKEWQEKDAASKKLKDDYDRLSANAKNWESWAPVLNQIAQPDVWARVQDVLKGGNVAPAAATPGATTTPTSTNSFNLDLPKDDFITGDVLVNSLEKAMTTQQQGMEQRFNSALNNAVQQAMQWIQNYHALQDEARRLEFEHLYDLRPKEGADFDLRKVLQTAAEKNLNDLRAAYQLTYGDADAKRAQAASTQQWQTEGEKREREAFERGKQEAMLAARNASAGIIPGGVTPRLEFKKEPSSYKDAEAQLREKLAGIGIRG